MFQIFVKYIVIKIIRNFLIKAFSLMVLRNKVKQVVLPTYQLYHVTYLMKITEIREINGRDKLNTIVKYQINIKFLTFNTVIKLYNNNRNKRKFQFFVNFTKKINGNYL